jgi:hypothetical protein
MSPVRDKVYRALVIKSNYAGNQISYLGIILAQLVILLDTTWKSG